MAEQSKMHKVNVSWPALPTETEIYILPNGEIVVADLPLELAASLAELGMSHATSASASAPVETEQIIAHVTDQQHQP